MLASGPAINASQPNEPLGLTLQRENLMLTALFLQVIPQLFPADLRRMQS